jgi:hypothetical protein
MLVKPRNGERTPLVCICDLIPPLPPHSLAISLLPHQVEENLFHGSSLLAWWKEARLIIPTRHHRFGLVRVHVQKALISSLGLEVSYPGRSYHEFTQSLQADVRTVCPTVWLQRYCISIVIDCCRVIFYVLVMQIMKSVVLWDMMPCT